MLFYLRWRNPSSSSAGQVKPVKCWNEARSGVANLVYIKWTWSSLSCIFLFFFFLVYHSIHMQLNMKHHRRRYYEWLLLRHVVPVPVCCCCVSIDSSSRRHTLAFVSPLLMYSVLMLLMLSRRCCWRNIGRTGVSDVSGIWCPSWNSCRSIWNSGCRFGRSLLLATLTTMALACKLDDPLLSSFCYFNL